MNDEELTERIVFQAQQYQMPPEEFVRRIQEAGQLGAVYSDVRRSKALIAAVAAATVTDESGAAVDMADLIGAADDSDAPEGARRPIPRRRVGPGGRGRRGHRRRGRDRRRPGDGRNRCDRGGDAGERGLRTAREWPGGGPYGVRRRIRGSAVLPTANNGSVCGR